MSLVRSGQNTVTRDRFNEGSGGSDVIMTPGPMTERMAREDLKWYLINKYRDLFIDKLSPEDLEEFQYYAGWQYPAKRGLVHHEHLKKFILKLREFVHDEQILKSEITGIESLLTLMKPEDLQNGRNDMPPRYNTEAGPVAGVPLDTLMGYTDVAITMAEKTDRMVPDECLVCGNMYESKNGDPKAGPGKEHH